MTTAPLHPTAPPHPMARFQAFVDKLREPAWLVREDTKAAYVNAAFRDYTGREQLEPEGAVWLDAVDEASREATESSLRAGFAGGEPFALTTRVRNHAGECDACSVDVVPLGEPGLWLATLTPAEPVLHVLPEPADQRVAPGELLHALLLEQAFEPAFAWELGDARRICFWNQAAEHLYGIQSSEALGRDPRELLGSAPLAALDDLDSRLAAHGCWTGELVQHTHDRRSLLIETAMKLVCFPDGRHVVLETGRDVTLRRAEERASAEAQKRLQLALSASRTGIWEWRVESDRLFWSPETFALMGADPRSFAGTQAEFARRVHPEDASGLWESFQRALARGGEHEHQYRMVRDDGGIVWVHNRCLIERGADGAAHRVIGTLRDITELHALHAELAKSEASYRALANAMPQIVWTTHADGGFDWINERWREYTGADEDGDAIRRSYVHPDDLGRISESWAAARASSVLCEFEYRLRRKDGVYRWHLARVVPRIEGGKLVRWLATATDIDDRKRAEEERERSEERARLKAEELATMMDAVPAAVLVAYDRECRELRGNRLAAEMFRTSPRANFSKTAGDTSATRHLRILREERELSPEELPVQEAARSGVALRDVELEIAFSEGTRMHVLGSAVPLRGPSGRPRGAIGAFVDVTRLKLAEEALRRADRRKDEFLALLSHELRNPLAPITSAVELLKLRDVTGIDRELEVIERQARHMVRLVDDLLDISRVARGKVELRRERIELAVVVARALEITTELFEQRRHRVSVHVPSEGLELEGDEVRLTQIVTNLLTNAARYTGVGGHVEVSAAREETEVVLRVRDDGMGIDPELLPRVFEMFVQGPRGPDRAEGGLGLGLSLVASLTALHGGAVSAMSDGPGLGSTFVVRLPSPPPAAHPQPSPPRPRAAEGSRRRRILIVDDNEDAAEMLALVLDRGGFEVRVAGDPPTALSLAAAWLPDIAILDIGLPVMDGHQLARELRTALGDRTPRLIALSGYGQPQDRRQSRESGFAHHLTKPIARKTLLDLLADDDP